MKRDYEMEKATRDIFTRWLRANKDLGNILFYWILVFLAFVWANVVYSFKFYSSHAHAMFAAIWSWLKKYVPIGWRFVKKIAYRVWVFLKDVWYKITVSAHCNFNRFGRTCVRTKRSIVKLYHLFRKKLIEAANFRDEVIRMPEVIMIESTDNKQYLLPMNQLSLYNESDQDVAWD